MAPSEPSQTSAWQLLLRFLGFGIHAWGGPVAQIGMLRRELVEKDAWVDSAHFNRVLGVYQVLPGPEAHELSVYLGFVRRGRLGAVLAGLGFMAPGVALMLLVSWVYFTWGIESSVIAAALAAASPVALALVVRAVRSIGAHALTSRWAWLIALAAGFSQIAGVVFVAPLVVGALVLEAVTRGRRAVAVVLLAALVCVSAAAIIERGTIAPPLQSAVRVNSAEQHPNDGEESTGDATLGSIARTGLSAGLLTFGGAYAAIPFVYDDAVVEGEWVTEQQFIDAVTLASVMPAPLVVFITFTGYGAGGLVGALLITLCVFLPSFLFTIVGFRRVEAAVNEPRIHALLDGVTAAVVGLIAVAAVPIAGTALVDAIGVAVFLGALIALARWKSLAAIPAVMACAALIGVARYWIA